MERVDVEMTTLTRSRALDQRVETIISAYVRALVCVHVCVCVSAYEHVCRALCVAVWPALCDVEVICGVGYTDCFFRRSKKAMSCCMMRACVGVEACTGMRGRR